MFVLQANTSGSRILEVNHNHLETIRQYALFKDLIDSTGVIDEDVLEKLRLNIRALIAAEEADAKPLLDLCIDVVYHPNMKAYGLKQLVRFYNEWQSV